MTKTPFIELEDISIRLRDRLYLQHTSWRMNSDEHWAILGPNGAGKSTFVKSLFGAVPVVRGKVTSHFSREITQSSATVSSMVGYVSSDLHRGIFECEKMRDSFRDFSGKTDEFTSVKAVILDQPYNGASDINLHKHQDHLEEVARKTGIGDMLERDIKSLSTGEISKALITRALIKRPKLLILDEPFEGLDLPARQSLSTLINDLMQGEMRVILVTHGFDEIMPGISHVLFLKSGRVHSCGRRKDLLRAEVIHDVYETKNREKGCNASSLTLRISDLERRSRQISKAPPLPADRKLVEMRHVNVKIGGVKAVSDFSWVMQRDENWAIYGPAGAGKTTILNLISGENLQAYANEIYLFGSRRGSGESIWDIKKHLGFISSDLQKSIPSNLKALDIVCSGFFGTLGLYHHCEAEKIQIANEWIKILGIEDLAETNFGFLSHGQKQMVLIARAMVKAPVLLILDEPCDGLDFANRSRFMNILDLIGRHTKTNLLYVPKREEEIPPCITHVLNMDGGKAVNHFRR
jgi:molybdate transport system ATP-binding protein